MKSVVVSLCLVLTVFSISAQDGNITIQKDGRVDQLLDVYSRHHNSFEQKPGFRIQIMVSTNRDRAYKTEADFKYRYGQFRTYMTYKSPHFKLRACDFTDKLKAIRFLQKVKSKYPGAFLVEEMVNVY